MKIHAIEWTTQNSSTRKGAFNAAEKLNTLLRLSSRGFLALVPALVIVVAASWLVTAPHLVVYLQTTLWVSGFLFIGLAIDTETPVNILSLLTAVALPVLALLSSRVAVEIAIVAAMLVAVWIAAAIWRR